MLSSRRRADAGRVRSAEQHSHRIAASQEGAGGERVMSLLRRFAGAMAALLSTVGIVCCIAGIAGIWMFHQGMSAKVKSITARLDGGLQRVSIANQNFQRALEQARASGGKEGKKST